ncbi:MAG: hypothetical protein EPN48_07915 [Microbacteriaceae bacterium]|nr:MAG: hypothetical protein EPN48_07915 [Microbacteriaceae bacterium]
MYFTGIGALLIVVYLVFAVTLAWALVLWIVVGHRWLALHPRRATAPQRATPDGPPIPPSG